MTSWGWANYQRPSPQTRQNPCPTSSWSQRRHTSLRTSRWTSTARPPLPHRSTSSATASGSTRRTTLWRSGWTRHQVSGCKQMNKHTKQIIFWGWKWGTHTISMLWLGSAKCTIGSGAWNKPQWQFAVCLFAFTFTGTGFLQPPF